MSPVFSKVPPCVWFYLLKPPFHDIFPSKSHRWSTCNISHFIPIASMFVIFIIIYHQIILSWLNLNPTSPPSFFNKTPMIFPSWCRPSSALPPKDMTISPFQSRPAAPSAISARVTSRAGHTATCLANCPVVYGGTRGVIYGFWLVVLTLLKNISQWEGLSHILYGT